MENDSNGCAVLFIHGILETPKFFDFLKTSVPENCKVYFLQLKGNKGSVRDFSAASMRVWKMQVRTAVKKLLSENKSLVIAAHSLGALLAVEEAVKQPCIRLFLINMPLKIHITPSMINICLRIFLDKVNPKDKKLLAVKRSYGIEKDRNIFHYVGWIPNYLELFSEISYVRGILIELTAPCLAYFSLNDEVVSVKSADFLKKSHKTKIKLLNQSGHYYYSEKDTEIMCKDLKNCVLTLMID